MTLRKRQALGSFMIMLAFHLLAPFILESEFNQTAFLFTLAGNPAAVSAKVRQAIGDAQPHMRHDVSSKGARVARFWPTSKTDPRHVASMIAHCQLPEYSLSSCFILRAWAQSLERLCRFRKAIIPVFDPLR